MSPWISKRKVGPPNKVEQQQQTSKRHNEKWSRYYQHKSYKKLRDWYMSLNPLCADCAIEGRSVPAEECHHRFPFTWWDTEEDRMKALLYYDWYVPLCRKCHEKRHKYLKRPENFEQTTEYKLIHELN